MAEEFQNADFRSLSHAERAFILMAGYVRAREAMYPLEDDPATDTPPTDETGEFFH